MQRRTFIFFTTLLLSFAASASTHASRGRDALAPHEASEVENRRAIQGNLDYLRKRSSSRSGQTPYRPVPDHADFQFLLFSAYGTPASLQMKITILKELPSHVTLILLSLPGDEARARKQFSQWIPANRVLVASHESASNGFWARDAYPVATYKNERHEVQLVGAKYYREFEGRGVLAKAAGAELTEKTFTFVGGNLLSDDEGTCFVVNSHRLYRLNKPTLTDAYGCRDVHFMPHVAGIGDVDEVLKPLATRVMLTNQKAYVPILEKLGYQVVQLPEAMGGEFRTYINSLIIDQKVFMPTFQVASDAEAKAAYEKLGYQVVPVLSSELSDNSRGSVHCMTMAYPKIDPAKIIRAIGARRYRF